MNIAELLMSLVSLQGNGRPTSVQGWFDLMWWGFNYGLIGPVEMTNVNKWLRQQLNGKNYIEV